MIKELNAKRPETEKASFIAENATIIGDVKLEEGTTVWYGAVIRGDGDSIRIGKNTNIQDKFSGREYARNILSAIDCKKRFLPSICGKCYVNLMVYNETLKNNIVNVYHRVWKNRRKMWQ